MYDWLREQAVVFRGCGVERTRVDDFIDWLDRTGATPWRSVEDGLPPSTVSVAVLRATGDWDKGYYGDNPWMGNSAKAWRYTNGERIEGVTHWQPRSPLPKEEG